MRERREMGGGSIQVLGFKRRWLSHKKKNTCPKVLLFSDMDISTTSCALCVVRSEKGRGLSPGLSTTMRKVMRFNLWAAAQQLKGSSPGGDAVRPSTAFVTSTVGRRRGAAAAVAFRVREDFIFLMIILQELSIKVDENSNCAASRWLERHLPST